MPKIVSIYTMSNQIDVESAADRMRGKVLESMGERGVVDESTLVLEGVTTDEVLNFGTEEDPILISLKDHNLVAYRFSAQAEPHSDELV